MNKIYCLILLNCLIGSFGFTQQSIGTCGTTSADNLLIKQRMLENREEWSTKILLRGGAPIYVPINYWLVAKNDGTGRLPSKNVIDNLCCLNKTYSEFDIVFYLKGIKEVNNTYIYDDPSSTLGAAYINQIMQSNKNAVNIFVANVANASMTGILAFYTSQGDYIVSGRMHVNSNCTTIAHEVGHFFSLPHTFFGWEETVYNDVTMTCTKPTPTIVIHGSSVLVEYVDRNKPGTVSGKKHCEQSADGFCDTPADYNLGFGFNGCNYDGCAKDPDNIKLDPSEINIMGYFLSCLKEFTPQQKDAITRDLLSNKRNYLRVFNYIPKPDITDQLVYNYPTAANPPPRFDTVKFEWEDVPNAEFYLFDLAENTGFNLNPKSFILKHSDTLLTGLKKNTNYYWRVTPFNANSFCVVPKITPFKTPAIVANEDIENPDLSIYVFQEKSNELSMVMNSSYAQEVTIQIVTANGDIARSQKVQLVMGKNNWSIYSLIPGLYFYRIISNNRNQNTGKFIKL